MARQNCEATFRHQPGQSRESPAQPHHMNREREEERLFSSVFFFLLFSDLPQDFRIWLRGGVVTIEVTTHWEGHFFAPCNFDCGGPRQATRTNKKNVDGRWNDWNFNQGTDNLMGFFFRTYNLGLPLPWWKRFRFWFEGIQFTEVLIGTGRVQSHIENKNGKKSNLWENYFNNCVQFCTIQQHHILK